MEYSKFKPLESVSLPPRAEGEEFPPCFGAKGLLEDTDVPFVFGRVCRFIFPKADLLDLDEDICNMLEDGGYDLDREDVKREFRRGFELSPVSCTGLFDDRVSSSCKGCPYHNEYSLFKGPAALCGCDVAELGAESLSDEAVWKTFVRGIKRSGCLSVEPYIIDGSLSFLLYVPEMGCFYIPVSLNDDRFKILSSEILQNRKIQKISSSPLLPVCFSSNFHGEEYFSDDTRKYGGIENLVCLSECKKSVLAKPLNNKETIRTGICVSNKNFASFMGGYKSLKTELFLKNERPFAVNKFYRILCSMFPVPDENGEIDLSNSSPLFGVGKNGEPVFFGSVDLPDYVPSLRTFSVTLENDKSFDVLMRLVCLLHDRETYSILKVRLVSLSLNDAVFLFPSDRKDAVYDALTVLVSEASGGCGGVQVCIS